MKILKYSDLRFNSKIKKLTQRAGLFDSGIENRTREILESVRKKGDTAVIEFTRRFDGAALSPSRMAVSPEEISRILRRADPALKSAVSSVIQNVASFSKESLRKNWSGRNAQGVLVGEKFDPIRRVGIYVPGGTAPLVSTALMTVVLAKAAGCPEIVVCTPCSSDGEVHPALLYAAASAGATEIFRVGGAQSIAAMAFGTKTIAPVDKIFGPGGGYVVAAKRLLFGFVSIDLLPGPSEVLVLADKTAPPDYIAADLLAQAEHGDGHERVWLVTDSSALLKKVEQHIKKQLPELARKKYAEKALRKGGRLVLARDMDQAIEITNRFAPEHCEVITKKPRQEASRITTAGALFLGVDTPTVLGDYLAGPSHELPTGGTGTAFSGLTADQFQRRTSIVQASKASLKRSASTVSFFANLEGLDAHGRSASIRLNPS